MIDFFLGLIVGVVVALSVVLVADTSESGLPEWADELADKPAQLVEMEDPLDSLNI